MKRSRPDYAVPPSAKTVNAALVAARGSAPLLLIAREHVSTFNTVNAATLLQRLARCDAADIAALDGEALDVVSRASLAALSTSRADENARTLTSIIFGAATLHLGGVVRALVERLGPRGLAAADAGVVSTLCWALGTLQQKYARGEDAGLALDAPLLLTLVCRVTAVAPSFSVREASQAAWGLSRAKIIAPLALAAIARAVAGTSAGDCPPQAMSTLAWAFAKAGAAGGGDSPRLFEWLERVAARSLRVFNPQDLGNLAWAFSRQDGGILARPTLLAEFAAVLTPARVATLPVSVVTNLMQALSTDAAAAARAVAAAPLAALGARAIESLLSADDCAPDDVGLIASAIARGVIQPRGADAASRALSCAAKQCGGDMSWRSVAFLDVAMRRLGEMPRGAARRALQARSLAVVDELARECDAAAASLSAHLLSLVPRPWPVPGDRRATVLLVGDDIDGRVGRALEEDGYSISRWRRFACDRSGGCSGDEAAPWPRFEGGHCDLAVLRYPGGADAFTFALAAIGNHLSSGASLIVHGTAAEGAVSASAVKSPYFSPSATPSTGLAGAVVWTLTRTPTPSGAALEAFASRVAVPALSPSWVTYPGLFAGGGLDVMTSALLSEIPALPPSARVLDFACGSGALAAALLAREPTLRVVLLDADAVALAAARENVQSARRVVCADGWPESSARVLGARKGFDVVVSNPPVHRGVPDDLRVLFQLVSGAAERLRAGGSLYLVTQAHVPVGPLCRGVRTQDGTRAWTGIDARIVDGGRFVVWRLVKRGETHDLR